MRWSRNECSEKVVAETMTTLQEVGAKLEAGVKLGPTDTAAMVGTDDLLGLGALADDRRRQRHGAKATFVRVHEMAVESVSAAGIEIPKEAGEIRLTGAAPDVAAATRAVRLAVTAAGSVPVTGFALETLAELCGDRMDSLVDLLKTLKDDGLALVAEARADRLPGPEWLDAVARSGLRIGRITVGTDDHGGVDLVQRVVGWGAAVATAHALAPLSRVQTIQPTTGYRDLRQVALARLLVDNIDSIQVDWSLYGPKLAQVALMFGADDIDTVSPDDRPDLGWRRAAREEITRNIKASALTPVERNGRFEILEILEV